MHAAPTQSYTLSLHDALPISPRRRPRDARPGPASAWSSPRPRRRSGSRDGRGGGRALRRTRTRRSEEHTSELQSRGHLVCRLLLEKKKKKREKTGKREQERVG